MKRRSAVDRPSHQPNKARHVEWALGVGIFAFSLLVLGASPVRQMADSKYSMLLSEALLYHRSFMLDRFAIPRLPPTVQSCCFRKRPFTYVGHIYQVQLVDDHLYYYFPPGSSVLSVPFVALMNALGVSASQADGAFSLEGETAIEARLAATLMAGLAVLLYVTARLLLRSRGLAVLIALGGVLGTQVWSTASRALWSETWGLVLVGIVIVMLVRHDRGGSPLRPFVLASLLAWTYFVRPTNAIAILAVTGYVLLVRRDLFPRYALAGGAWLGGFVVFSWYHFHDWLPHYYLYQKFSEDTFGEALAGHLISPSRGLLIFVPVVGFVAYVLARYRDALEHRRLVAVSLAVVVGHLVLISLYDFWVGGHSYGPRYTTALVPWLVLLSILGIKAMVAAGTGRRSVIRIAEVAAGGALLLVSVFMNAQGAIFQSTYTWNSGPPDVSRDFARVWDWRDPQFLAGLKAMSWTAGPR
jgi:hypothetical protein